MQCAGKQKKNSKEDTSEYDEKIIRFAAFELASFAEIESQAVYCAANAYWEPLKVQLPEGNWYRIVDTGSREEGGDIHSQESANLISGEFEIGPRSTMVFLKQSEQE